jgi:hypothetical protein
LSSLQSFTPAYYHPIDAFADSHHEGIGTGYVIQQIYNIGKESIMTSINLSSLTQVQTSSSSNSSSSKIETLQKQLTTLQKELATAQKTASTTEDSKAIEQLTA